MTVQTREQLAALAKELSSSDVDFISFDTETTGLDEQAEVIGFSVAWSIDPPIGYYVALSSWDKEQECLVRTDVGARETIVPFLQLLAKKSLIMQNGGFDVFQVKKDFGVDLMPALHTDTLLLGHLLNENRLNGLKERGVELFGINARIEQTEMKASVQANGGVWQDKAGGIKEMYKADLEPMARYGAKDAILTLQVFYHDVPILFEEGLDKFFYEDETMPLLRGPTQDLNTVGLRVDLHALQKLRGELEADILSATAFIHQEIDKHIKADYPGTSAKKTFNIGSNHQIAWLLYHKLGQRFHVLTKGGRELCKALRLKLPYSNAAKRDFIEAVTAAKGRIWAAPAWNYKTRRMSKPKKIGDVWTYLSAGKESLNHFSEKYAWVKKLLELKKNDKLLNTYVIGIQDKQRYGVIHPSFLQHGTTSGRYSSRAPNFQNLPADDKRVKKCIIARPGRVFVGADQSQLEPRVFASQSKDARLLECFRTGDDFYSVIGAETFNNPCSSLVKGAPDSFSVKYPKLRDISKKVGLSATYGTTAPKMAVLTGMSMDEAQEVIDQYFAHFPDVHEFMLSTHEEVKDKGVVYNMFGRPRRMPEAKKIRKVYGDQPHHKLPYNIRTLLNLAVNHKVQSTGASIMNRAAIACYLECRRREVDDPRWRDVRMVLQVHDEIVLEGPKEIAKEMGVVLRTAMEGAVSIPGVDLVAEPKIANNIADLK